MWTTAGSVAIAATVGIFGAMLVGRFPTVSTVLASAGTAWLFWWLEPSQKALHHMFGACVFSALGFGVSQYGEALKDTFELENMEGMSRFLLALSAACWVGAWLG